MSQTHQRTNKAVRLVAGLADELDAMTRKATLANKRADEAAAELKRIKTQSEKDQQEVSSLRLNNERLKKRVESLTDTLIKRDPMSAGLLNMIESSTDIKVCKRDVTQYGTVTYRIEPSVVGFSINRNDMPEGTIREIAAKAITRRAVHEVEKLIMEDLTGGGSRVSHMKYPRRPACNPDWSPFDRFG